MRSLKKRILSFISAVAMVATVVPITGLFASAEATTITFVDSNGIEEWNSSGSSTTGTFTIDSEVEATLSYTYWTDKTNDRWGAIHITKDGTDYTSDIDGDLGAGQNVNKTKTVTLDAGTYNYEVYVKNCKLYDVTLAYDNTPAKDPVNLSTLGVTISAMSNDVNKGTVSPNGILETPNSAKLSYTVKDDNNFVGWYVRSSDDNTSGQLLNKKAELDVNAVSGYIAEYAAKHSGKNLTIFATFAGWKNYRYEAEDYVKLVSETQYKYLNTSEEHDKYDDPTVVLEGNTGYTEGTASNTVYGSDGKFADGHWAKAAGGSTNLVLKETIFDDATGRVLNSDDWQVEVDATGLTSPKVIIEGWVNGGSDAQIWYNTTDLMSGKTGSDSNFTVEQSLAAGSKINIVLKCNSGYADVKTIKLYDQEAITGTGDKVKYQHYYGDGSTFDAKSYSDLKIAPKYSNGQAVALTGPSNGLAIPFNLTEATTTNMEVELGYNLGTMPKTYDNGNNDTPVWINIYYLGSAENGLNDYSKFESAITSDGARWAKSGNAYYDRATGALKAMMPSNVSDLHPYTSYYFGASEEGDDQATYIDGTKVPGGDDNRSSDRRVTLKLPQGLPTGSYTISVATDQRNCDDDSEPLIDEHGEYHKVGDENGWHAGTAYYDYIQFRMIDDPTKPNVFVSGADISFTDSGIGNDGEDSKMKNTLRVTEFSDVSFDENGLKFTPVAPEFLVNQGYEFTGWTLKVNKFPGKDGVGDRVILNEILNGAEPADYSATCAAISSYAFPAGTSIEFIANYKIENGSQILTVENGTIYIPEGGRNNNNDGTEETENYTIAAKDKNVTLRRFANVKLVADEKEGETFSHWTVNGMIYSYNKEIFFSSVYNATFVANYDNDVTEPEATAYIDKNVALSGFSDADNTNQQKITFLAEYSINDGSYNIKDKFDNAEFGLIYAATDEGLANMKSAKNSSTFSGSIARCGKMVVTNKENIIRNETFFGIGGLRLGRTYYAMSYVVYNGKVYYSDIVSIAPTAADNNVVKTATIVE